jgi:hypothetical protein
MGYCVISSKNTRVFASMHHPFKVVIRGGARASCRTALATWDAEAQCPRLAGDRTVRTCFCSCPVPYDGSYTVWVAVFSQEIAAGDKPMHTLDLPFPLYLPLYPDRDVVLMAFVCKNLREQAPPPVYLHWPPADVMETQYPLDLTADTWAAAAPEWTAAVSSLTMSSWLAYAFDDNVSTAAVLEEEEEEDTAELLLHKKMMRASGQITATVVAADSDGDEDEETGLGEEVQAADGYRSVSEDEFEYEDGEEDDEDEDGEDSDAATDDQEE